MLGYQFLQLIGSYQVKQHKTFVSFALNSTLIRRLKKTSIMKSVLAFTFLYLVWADASSPEYDFECRRKSPNLHFTRTLRERGKYLGCFQDKNLPRMFRGYFGRDDNLTIDKCINLCAFYRFVYAGFHGLWVE